MGCSSHALLMSWMHLLAPVTPWPKPGTTTVQLERSPDALCWEYGTVDIGSRLPSTIRVGTADATGSATVGSDGSIGHAGHTSR